MIANATHTVTTFLLRASPTAIAQFDLSRGSSSATHCAWHRMQRSPGFPPRRGFIASFSVCAAKACIVQASFRSLASLVMRKLAPDVPLAQRSALVHLTGAWYCGRNHQVPTHQRERGSMADSHAGEISNRRASDKSRTISEWCAARFPVMFARIRSDSFLSVHSPVARTARKRLNKDHDENENSSDGVRSDLLTSFSAQLAQSRSGRLVSGTQGPMGSTAKRMAIPRLRRQRIPPARQKLGMVQRA